MEARHTLEIKIKGRVQGVNFRNSAQKYANMLHLTGYARNMRDGSVVILVQGPSEALQEYLQWCQRGSWLSKVDEMSYKWVDEMRNYDDFEVQRSGSFLKDQIQSFFNLGKRVGEDIILKDENSLDMPNYLKVPEHVVLIPNGNRRWARERGLQPWEAYWYVQKKIESIIHDARKLNIKHFTLWGFSTENWKRDEKEVEQLIKLFHSTIDRFSKNFVAEQIRFRHLGRRDRLPKSLIEKFEKLEEKTKNFGNGSVNVAIDYGGRDEIIRGIEALIKEGKEKVDEEEFSKFLDTCDLPDPDLIIRTAGEKRLSGMLAWQSVYSELYSTYVYFPDFEIEHFKEAILDYGMRKRTFGGDGKSKDVEEVNMNSNIKKFATNTNL